ncbi:metallophosphoesterase family protein [Microbacterium halophytorum]|uniref:metallophosphoesterase family protein n=1 Tax=Microbacterium halophytorum TaxID=2067568 RepID=UPI000CFDA8E4|nr:metallophosphoesterase [Microbacterium halophytorum]
MSRESGRLTVLHISDVHATADGRLYDRVDGVERLRAVGDYARDAGVTPEAIVVTGDLIQRGNPDAYPRLEAALDDLERAAGVPVLTVLGNHDDARAARGMRRHAGGHHRIEHIAGMRFALLDSSTGALGAEQTDWLREQLREPYGAGTVVALHHPPLGSPLPTLAKAGLADAGALLDVLAGSDALAVLAGHFHHPLSATLRGVPVSVGPALAYHQVMNAGPDVVAGHDQAMFSLVHLLPGGVAATSISLDSPAPLFTQPVTA